MIRITIQQPAKATLHGEPPTLPAPVVKEFEDHAAAAVWLVEDSYFDQQLSVLWEQVTPPAPTKAELKQRVIDTAGRILTDSNDSPDIELAHVELEKALNAWKEIA